MMKMGMPEDEAERMVGEVARVEYGCDPGKLPAHDMRIPMRACAECGARAGFHKTSLVPPGDSAYGVPMLLYRMSDEMRVSGGTLSETELAQAREMREDWAEDKPLIASRDGTVLGSWSIREHERRAADEDVLVMRFDEDVQGASEQDLMRLHAMAEIITGGAEGLPWFQWELATRQDARSE